MVRDGKGWTCDGFRAVQWGRRGGATMALRGGRRRVAEQQPLRGVVVVAQGEEENSFRIVKKGAVELKERDAD